MTPAAAIAELRRIANAPEAPPALKARLARVCDALDPTHERDRLIRECITHHYPNRAASTAAKELERDLTRWLAGADSKSKAMPVGYRGTIKESFWNISRCGGRVITGWRQIYSIINANDNCT